MMIVGRTRPFVQIQIDSGLHDFDGETEILGCITYD